MVDFGSILSEISRPIERVHNRTVVEQWFRYRSMIYKHWIRIFSASIGPKWLILISFFSKFCGLSNMSIIKPSQENDLDIDQWSIKMELGFSQLLLGQIHRFWFHSSGNFSSYLLGSQSTPDILSRILITEIWRVFKEFFWVFHVIRNYNH